MKTKQNASLEEFSLQRFNPLKKLLKKFYEDMKPIFEKNEWDVSVVDKMEADTLAYLDKSVADMVEFFKNDKPRLEYALDYLMLHFYSRVIYDLLSKSYREEAGKFEEDHNQVTFTNSVEFFKQQKHWASGMLKPMLDVIAKRKVVDPRALEYFKEKSLYSKNIEEGLQHFYGLFPLPEYRELKKVKWEDFSIVSQESVLRVVDYLNQMEHEINEVLKEKSVLPSKEIDLTPGAEKLDGYLASDNKTKLLRKGKTLIEFADGAKWVDLQVPACSLEAASLEHCGNNYRANETNLRVWSFRTPTDEKDFYVGRLTFIFNTDNRMIGEAKARNNQKPQSKYHPYIVELLLLPMVEGLEQGRHATHQDFAFADLNDELLLRLINEKPTLFSKSKVGRSVIISRNLGDVWKAAFKKVTGENPPDLDQLKFDK